MDKQFAVYSSPVGDIKIGYKKEKLTLLKISKNEIIEHGKKNSFTDMVYAQILEYFRGERQEFKVDIDLDNVTPFQNRVFQELQKIKYGDKKSYKEIAEAIGNSKAARAVGMANNRNPIHIIIPCHRVVGSHGELTGYAAGIDIKEFLLNLESK